MVSRPGIQSWVADPARNRSVQFHRGEGARGVPGAGKSAGQSGERQHRIAIVGFRLERGGQAAANKAAADQLHLGLISGPIIFSLGGSMFLLLQRRKNASEMRL